VVPGEAVHELVEVGAGEFPVERCGGRVVAVFEGEYLAGEGAEVGEVVGDEQLALDDGEVDLYLVEPGCVDGQVHHLGVGPGVIEPGSGRPVAVRGAVAGHPEHPPGGCVWLGGRDMVHQGGEGGEAGGGLAPAGARGAGDGGG